MKFNQIAYGPSLGDYVILASDLWFVFTVDVGWREMTAEEQIEASK